MKNIIEKYNCNYKLILLMGSLKKIEKMANEAAIDQMLNVDSTLIV